jgi:hypothetical protein
MARYHGKKGRVMLSTSASGTAATAVSLNRWSLRMPTDKAEVSCFGDNNKQYVQGFPDVSGQFGGFWDDTSDDLYDASRSEDGVKVYLYPSTDALTKYWYGPAWVDFEIDAPATGPVTVGASFVAAGDWGQR